MNLYLYPFHFMLSRHGKNCIMVRNSKATCLEEISPKICYFIYNSHWEEISVNSLETLKQHVFFYIYLCVIIIFNYIIK